MGHPEHVSIQCHPLKPVCPRRYIRSSLRPAYVSTRRPAGVRTRWPICRRAYRMIPAREVVAVTEESGSMFRVRSAMCSPIACIEARSAEFARNDKLASSLGSSCCLSGTFRSCMALSKIVARIVSLCNSEIHTRCSEHAVVGLKCSSPASRQTGLTSSSPGAQRRSVGQGGDPQLVNTLRSCVRASPKTPESSRCDSNSQTW